MSGCYIEKCVGSFHVLMSSDEAHSSFVKLYIRWPIMYGFRLVLFPALQLHSSRQFSRFLRSSKAQLRSITVCFTQYKFYLCLSVFHLGNRCTLNFSSHYIHSTTMTFVATWTNLQSPDWLHSCWFRRSLRLPCLFAPCFRASVRLQQQKKPNKEWKKRALFQCGAVAMCLSCSLR